MPSGTPTMKQISTDTVTVVSVVMPKIHRSVAPMNRNPIAVAMASPRPLIRKATQVNISEVYHHGNPFKKMFNGLIRPK